MRKYLFMPLLACSLFTACNKDKEDKNALKYTINGLTDIAIENPGKLSIPLEVEYQWGTQERVTLSVEGLPKDVSSSFTAANGIPTFASVLSLENKETTAGTYPVKVTGTTASGKSQSFDIKLTVKSHCRESVLGTYTGTDCDRNPVTIAVAANPDSVGSGHILITGIPKYETYSVKAKLSCPDKIVTAPVQTIGNEKISIQGTFDADAGTLKFTYQFYNLSVYSCTLDLKRKK